MRLPFSKASVRRSQHNGLVFTSSHGEVWAFGTKQTSARYEDMLERSIAKAGKAHVESVLMLGLAGGGAVGAISKAYPGCALTCVEYDKVMADIAQELLRHKPYPMPRIVITDAQEALQTLSDTYDLVLVDIFTGALPSPLTQQDAFWQLLKLRLKPDGRVILNVAGAGTHRYVAQKHFARHWTWQDRYNTFCALSDS